MSDKNPKMNFTAANKSGCLVNDICYFYGWLDIEPDIEARHFIVRIRDCKRGGFEIDKVLAAGPTLDEALMAYNRVD